MIRHHCRTTLVCIVALAAASTAWGQSKDEVVGEVIKAVGANRGICVFVGLPEIGQADLVVELAKASELTLYVQSQSQDEVQAMYQAADAAGLLGTRIFVDQGPWGEIQLAGNSADAVFVGPAARDAVPREEVLRVLHPNARGFIGNQTVSKPAPAGLESWSHPYHGADNNPNSADQQARYPYLTQFLGEPMFGCISEVTVAADGRVFKAFGHIAFREVQNEVLNTLYGINGYNGTILWQRKLKEGFMIHRNTMVATPDVLYLADDESCKLIDTRTGKTQREIKAPAATGSDQVWKWMALENGTLYALIGSPEVGTQLHKGDKPGYGGWPWGMWKGYDYSDPSKAFGFGKHVVALDAQSGELKWHFAAPEFLDGRALCLRNGRMYVYAPDKFLICLDTKTGKPLWENKEEETLAAIGKNGRAQGYIRGFSTTCYMKCSDDYLFFSGPQRNKLAAVSAKDGKLLWTFGDGNYQLVLRDDALYAFGPQRGKSHKLDYATGDSLAEFSGRRACTRATGSVDSMFCRATGGTIRLVPGSAAEEHIAPMRPACHDGVIISEGYLYWGPWICACQLTLFGHIGLGPAGEFDFEAKPVERERLTLGSGNLEQVKPNDGPDAANEFTAGDDGVVRALRGDKLIWKAYTGGGINFPPVVENHRVFVGSNDGRVYAFEAATGRLLWKFRAAPQVRRIQVYGPLMSTWPVAGGVAVKDGTVYAAAGIAHYDGTHVYALDAASGKLKWHNGTSGALSEKFKNGISLCGQVQLGTNRRGQPALKFHGGNAVPEALFDLATGECLSTEPKGPAGVGKSTFYVDQWMKRKQAQE